MEEKKISLPEIIIMGMLVISSYLFSLFADLSAPVPVVGLIIYAMNWAWDLVVLGITQFWLIMKGGVGVSRQLTMLGGNLFDSIPYANLLPVNVVIFFLVVYLINHPKVMEKFEKVSKATSGKIPARKQEKQNAESSFGNDESDYATQES